jgi:methyltransferase (TIGR00027 family)
MPDRSQSSASALNVARCRAIAAHETREEIRGHDHLAELFLDDAARLSLSNPAVYPLILKKLDDFSPGSYEYFIARTAYLDEVVERALSEQIPQLVFLGAGYDTRACRFSHLLRGTRVFELDEPFTQNQKRAALEAAQVAFPEQLVFVPIDFNTDNLGDRLAAAGYVTDKETLFIWEGVTYYLPPQTVDEMLHFVRHHAPAGSRICFDYMLPKTQLGGRFGAGQARAAMEALYTDEPLLFDLDETQVMTFLDERGFELADHLTAEQMQARYLMLAGGAPAGRILDLFRLAQARVAGE